MTQVDMVTRDIDGALRLAHDGLKKYPFDQIYKHTIEKVAKLQSFLALNEKGRDIGLLKDFDLGMMAVKELGSDEEEFAKHLHGLQHYVDDILKQ